MNTQPTSTTCKTGGSYCEFGAETLQRLLEGIDSLIDGVISSTDIEYVHKTRVASRRLRAALPLFRCCYPKKTYKAWTEEIKKVTRLLAAARDLDVQITFLEQYAKKLGSAQEKTAIDAILASHRVSRRRAQKAVVAGLEELKATGTLNWIRSFCVQTVTDQTRQPVKQGEVLEQAHWHISFRLDDFLSMEKYVPQERKHLQHHQMRIYAKKLRYTMECFAPLYQDKLVEEISTMKEFQDVLGEMHDCDIWLEVIAQFRKRRRTNQTRTAKTEFNKALKNFSAYVSERKKRFYSQFTELWKEKKQNGFFVEMTKKTGAEFITKTYNSTVEALKNPNVKIAVISDVHANLQALQAVVEDAQRHGAEVFLNAGDSIGFGANPNEVVELLCEKNVLSVIGNFDLEVLEGDGDAKGEKKLVYSFARNKLVKAAECYLSGLPRELRFEVGGRNLLVTHGAPGDIDEHIRLDASEEQFKGWAEKADADLVVVGHSHEQFQRQVVGVDFVNPGSVGRPGDGNPKAAYALISFNPFKLELMRIDYDVENAAGALRRAGLPESFAQMLLSGVSLDFILQEDHAKWAVALKNQEKTVEACEDFAVGCWPDAEHFKQVTGLSLALFDALSEVHKLGARERCWLRCAAILHDVGLSKTGDGKHHKKSAQIILNTPKLPFSSKERRIIACIARYHRRALPKPRHTNLSALDRKTFDKICVLAGVLRVADSLDYAQQSNVKVLGVNVGTKKLSVECISKSELTSEEEAFNKKKDLLEKVLNRRMVLIWNRQDA